jgi:M6 family metalloprotease-like protein
MENEAMRGHSITRRKGFILIAIVLTIVIFSTGFISQDAYVPQAAAAQGAFPSDRIDVGTSNTTTSNSVNFSTSTIGANKAPAPKVEKVLVLRAQLNGSIFTTNSKDMSALFENSVRDYYSDDSYNQVLMNVSYVPNNYTLPYSELYYSAPTNLVDLVRDTLTAAQNDVSRLGGYSSFRHLIIVHSGPDRAATLLPSDIGSEFVNSSSGPLVVIDGVNIENACIVSEEDPLGVVVHELGHSQGLPDLYSYQAETEEPPESDPFVGSWDLMATGAWSPNGQGTSPCYMTTWCKIDLGWIDSTHIASISQSEIQSGANETVLLDPQEVMGPILAIKILLTNGTYFLIEDRQPIGYDASIPASGVLILFCDDSKPTGDGPVRVVSASPPDLGPDAVFNVGFFAKDFYGSLSLNIGVKVLNKWNNGTFKVLVGQYNSVYNAPVEYVDMTVPVIIGVAIVAVISIVSIAVYVKRGRRMGQASRQEVTGIRIF